MHSLDKENQGVCERFGRFVKREKHAPERPLTFVHNNWSTAKTFIRFMRNGVLCGLFLSVGVIAAVLDVK